MQVINPRYEEQYRETASRYLTPQQNIRAEVKASLNEERIHSARSFWWNPAVDPRLIEKDPVTGNRPKPNSIYFGENESRSRPTWQILALNYGKYSNYIKSADASQTDRPATRFDHIVGCFGPEIESDAYSYLKSLEADVMTSGDFPNMQLLSTFVEVLDTQLRQFSLINAVTTKATNVLSLQAASYLRYQITEDLGELEFPESRKGSFTTSTYKLKKSGGAIAFSDEFQMQNWILDPMSYASQNLSTDITRIKAKKISASLASLTSATTTSGDWSAFANTGAAEHSDKNPLLAFTGMKSEMYANYGLPPDTVCSNDRTYNYYMSNTYVSPLVSTPQTTANTMAGVVPSPGLPGVQWFIDSSLPDNFVYFFSKSAVWHIQGPERSSSYRDELPGMSGMIYRSWFNSVVFQTAGGRKLTGIAP